MKNEGKKLLVLWGKILLLIITNLAFLVAAIGLSSLIPLINPIVNQILKITFEFVFWSIFAFVIVPLVYKFPKKYDRYKLYLDEIHLSAHRPFSKVVIYTISCYTIFVICQLVGSLIYGHYVFDFNRILPPNSYWLINLNAGIFEEIMFRGIILAMLIMHRSEKKSIIISALIFGAVHFANLINGVGYEEILYTSAQVVWAIGMGVLWGILTVETKSLLPGIILHYLSNALDSLWLFTPSASIEIKLLFMLLFGKFIPIIISIVFVKLLGEVIRRKNG